MIQHIVARDKKKRYKIPLIFSKIPPILIQKGDFHPEKKILALPLYTRILKIINYTILTINQKKGKIKKTHQGGCFLFQIRAKERL